MRQLVMTAILIMLALPAGALEVPFRDGSVIEVVSYTVNGSYLMLEMDNGARVAYDVADIDLDTLNKAAAAAAAERAPQQVPPEPTTLGVTGLLQVPEATPAASSAGLTITDEHVKHIRGSGIAGPEDEVEAAPAGDQGTPEGYEEGGGVLLNNLSVSPLEGGEWQVKGEVVNRTAETVLDVKANLRAAMPEGDPWTASVGVSGMLGPDEKVAFTHTFATPEAAGEAWTPSIQVSVVWMKSETRLEPNYNRLPPHPSSLPYDRGGVGGAEVSKREEIPF